MVKIFILFLCIFGYSVTSVKASEINKPFGEWLVSCKQNMMTAKNDCFIGTQFLNDDGRGAIVFTKYYLAVAHNETNLNKGVDFEVDKNQIISSFMNTGVSVFFKNDDRKRLLSQMQKGNNLNINIKGKNMVVKSLNGFIDAYNFYIKQIES